MKIRSVAILGILVLSVSAARGSADNTTCAGATLLGPDGSLQEGDLGGASTSRWYRFVAKAGRSYALMLENLSPADQQPESTQAGGGPTGTWCFRASAFRCARYVFMSACKKSECVWHRNFATCSTW